MKFADQGYTNAGRMQLCAVELMCINIVRDQPYRDQLRSSMQQRKICLGLKSFLFCCMFRTVSPPPPKAPPEAIPHISETLPAAQMGGLAWLPGRRRTQDTSNTHTYKASDTASMLFNAQGRQSLYAPRSSSLEQVSGTQTRVDVPPGNVRSLSKSGILGSDLFPIPYTCPILGHEIRCSLLVRVTESPCHALLSRRREAAKAAQCF